ncbi:Imm7 family immunity protein [Amycolatopsis tucumanensis]|uniref:Imm7 family immunity protein n=1 Tax=Amycolatopsis tucumanensis TaxID=401106 RepID=UPI00355755DE
MCTNFTALRFVSRRLPGSYGLLYERDDEMRIPPGPNAFPVTPLARGNVCSRHRRLMPRGARLGRRGAVHTA